MCLKLKVSCNDIFYYSAVNKICLIIMLIILLWSNNNNNNNKFLHKIVEYIWVL